MEKFEAFMKNEKDIGKGSRAGAQNPPHNQYKISLEPADCL